MAMTPADEGIAAAKADNEATRLALAELNAREITRRAASVLADLKQYRDPALLDPSDLDEIGRELEQLRKIAEEAVDARGPFAVRGPFAASRHGKGSWRERSQDIAGAEAPEEFPTEGAATGGYVGRYYRGRRMTDGSPVCQHIVESLRDLAEWPAALSAARLDELSNALGGATASAIGGRTVCRPDGATRAVGVFNAYLGVVLTEIDQREQANRKRCIEALEETRQTLDSEPTADPVAEPKADPVQDPVEVARSLCSGSENIHTLSGDAALDEARIILLSLKPGTRGHDCLLGAFLAAGISTDIDEPKPDLDLVDTGGGCKALGFEMRLPGLDLEVLITNGRGHELPDEGENLAALYIDGDERARLEGNFEAVTRWARVIKRELEELQARDQLRFVSWSRFARAFDGVLR